ncbi:MAG: hypothetical protein HZY79_07385 [Rhodoblastus sp.]|nr:MAG: hypothetical protein HZY79_07385 [Rhodoblastus sp.]
MLRLELLTLGGRGEAVGHVVVVEIVVVGALHAHRRRRWAAWAAAIRRK